MIKKNKVIFVLVALLALSCSKEYLIEYQDGYPNKLADNWVAFEFQGGDIEGTILKPYNLVTSLDPNNDSSLIIDKLYNADIRVRTTYSDSTFHIHMGEQLEQISQNNYGIEYVCVDGYITSNPVLIDFINDAAGSFYENISFAPDVIEDILFLRAGFYDEFKSRIDTVLVLGYRKTGFEDVEF